jgi:hypothetical protein
MMARTLKLWNKSKSQSDVNHLKNVYLSQNTCTLILPTLSKAICDIKFLWWGWKIDKMKTCLDQ